MRIAGYEEATPCFLPKRQVYSLAESVANQLEHKPGDDIHALVERIGGTVTVQDTLMEDPERSGSLYVDAHDDFRIIVPAHTSGVRDRFTIAHELGHYVLHYVWKHSHGENPPERMYALRKGSERVEWEANWFASGFLMPEAHFREAFQRLRNVAAVAAELDVSLPAAEIRARQLGLA
jgi:Zn-dependent peptidase ImmA (M78 family)